MLRSEVASSPASGYFVHLPDINVTINLTQIAYVEWNEVKNEKVNPMYITTVTLAGGGGFYLTKEGHEVLWKALQVFNQRQVQPGLALNRIYDLLFWLNNVELPGTKTTASNETTNSSSPAATIDTNPATDSSFYKPSRVRGQEHKEHKRECSPVTN